ncbi:MAG: DUF4852 domain-containing protein [Micavibrio sp.]|nr:MAG: DUF4852 domain-containing protein [Micavibrio sp.]
MNIKNAVICLFLTFALTFAPPPKNAHGFTEIGTGYLVTSFQSLVTTFLLSLPADERQAKYIDGYARIFDCDVVEEHYRNEFEWRNIRERINQRINRIQREYFSYYEFIGSVELDTYDFEREVFPLHSESQLNGVRILSLFRLTLEVGQSRKYCAHAFGRDSFRLNTFLPTLFTLRLPSSITVRNIPMTPDAAEHFGRTVEQDERIGRRRIFLRFRVRLDAIAEITARSESSAENVIFNGQLLELDAFADRNMEYHLAKLDI